jgi:hypothetical protein
VYSRLDARRSPQHGAQCRIDQDSIAGAVSRFPRISRPTQLLLGDHRRDLRDLLVRRVVDVELLRRLGYYLTGTPSAGSVRYRIRRFSPPPPKLAQRHLSVAKSFRLTLARVTTPWGFSFHEDGWHPYVATIRRWLKEGELDLEGSPLYALYQHYRPRTVQDALLDDLAGCAAEPLNAWPMEMGLLNVWSMTAERVRLALGAVASKEGKLRQFIGPRPDRWVEQDLVRLIEVFQSIKEHGYAPRRFSAPPISGYFLVDGDDYRFVCHHGSHRLAAMTCLGYRDVCGTVLPDAVPIVDSRDLVWWSTERGGLFSVELTREIFRAMFHENGRDKAKRLGILPS